MTKAGNLSLPSDVDVVVIGGGPGGSATAIYCAQHGLQVVLLEQSAFPRHRPGETLHPGIEPLLEQLGVAEQVLEAGFLRHEGQWVDWGDKPSAFQAFGQDQAGPWLGFQVIRSQFDSYLLEQAKALGVQVLQPCPALAPLTIQGRVTGVQIAAGEIRASYLVDAAGGNHWLARQLPLEITPYSPKLLVYYGYARGDYPARDAAPAIQADAEGWTWIARVQPQRYQWTRFSFAQQQLDRDWRPPELADLDPEGRSQAADVTWRLVRAAAGLGYFLVGDAATVLDPASSHGVLKAITSGMMVAHLICEANDLQRSEAEIAKGYCQWLEQGFWYDLQHLQALYGLVT
ncbi:MAG: FAD-dependent oxidoreductase [Acaryochloridaceae cyanobacterium SU_2_1]|nr:FAD-dependent oxidoreductase [Acaryochloridaceae cyanobacterium SU_2_1]NJM95712.1 FAD-dependent oxidoreductase [Acaryochloridaceae cyanobacterium CSU_5_19]